MHRLIVKKDVGAEGSQNLLFGNASQKKSFIYPDIPCAQGPDNPFMGRCASGGDKGRPDRCLIRRELLLQYSNGFEEACKRPFLQGTAGLAPFVFFKSGKPLLLENPFGFIRKQDSIPVKGNADLPDFLLPGIFPHTVADYACRNAGIHCPLHVILTGRKKKVRTEGFQVRGKGRAPCKNRTGDIQPIMLYGTENTQRSIRAVS